MSDANTSDDVLQADVIIAGAGMAGATLALALKQAGLEPVLIDPVPFEAQVAPTFDGRASAIAFSCFRQWRALSAAGRIEPVAQRIEQILVTDGRPPGAAARSPSAVWLRFDSAEIADRTEGEPLGWLIENRHIRAGLAETVRGAGITVLAPAKVARTTSEGAVARVELEDGRVLAAPLVVGVDGRDSRVRRTARRAGRSRRRLERRSRRRVRIVLRRRRSVGGIECRDDADRLTWRQRRAGYNPLRSRGGFTWIPD